MHDTNTLQLSHLEIQIDKLMGRLQQLQRENDSLRHQLARSIRERNSLHDKNKKAIAKIKHIIAQLKEHMS